MNREEIFRNKLLQADYYEVGYNTNEMQAGRSLPLDNGNDNKKVSERINNGLKTISRMS